MNPVWNAFCAGKMEDWLEWLRTIHVNSYLELTERFIATHPFFANLVYSGITTAPTIHDPITILIASIVVIWLLAAKAIESD